VLLVVSFQRFLWKSPFERNHQSLILYQPMSQLMAAQEKLPSSATHYGRIWWSRRDLKPKARFFCANMFPQGVLFPCGLPRFFESFSDVGA
jgi:hypothetical protein